MTENERCPDCDGKGTEKFDYTDRIYDERLHCSGLRDCRKCKGTGEITSVKKVYQERDFRKEDLERDLTEELKKWRAERPDEWKMDEFIRISKIKQDEIDRLRKELDSQEVLKKMLRDMVNRKDEEIDRLRVEMDKHIKNEASLIVRMGQKDIEIQAKKEKPDIDNVETGRITEILNGSDEDWPFKDIETVTDYNKERYREIQRLRERIRKADEEIDRWINIGLESENENEELKKIIEGLEVEKAHYRRCAVNGSVSRNDSR